MAFNGVSQGVIQSSQDALLAAAHLRELPGDHLQQFRLFGTQIGAFALVGRAGTPGATRWEVRMRNLEPGNVP